MNSIDSIPFWEFIVFSDISDKNITDVNDKESWVVTCSNACW